MTLSETALQDLAAQGKLFAARQTALSSAPDTRHFQQQTLNTIGSTIALAQYADEQSRHQPSSRAVAAGIRRLEASTRLLRASAIEVQGAMRVLKKLPFARSVTGIDAPRVVGVAQGLLNASRYQWSVQGFSTFLRSFQAEQPLNLRELWAVPVALKLVLLDEILNQASGAFSELPTSDQAMDAALLYLHEISLPVWQNLLEPLVPFEPILAQDPAAAYTRMDFESRDLYRAAVADIAARSPMSEMQIAGLALSMAREERQRPNVNERVTDRHSHVGYFLVDNGVRELKNRCGFRPRVLDRVRSVLRAYPDDFYIGGIQTIALLTIAAIILPLVPRYNPFGSLGIAFLLLLLPVSQGAVELLNHTVTAILKPQPLPKLDFSEGIPADCKTLVAIPTLLLNEKQVRDLVEELEVRSLANQDPNIHFALLTDLPDSVQQPLERDIDDRVLLAGRLIDDLNRRYYASGAGSFLMLHRSRIFNPRQGVWMGWERKRGKLLDLNRLVMGGMDCFPFKAGNTSVLNGMRYVLTLDSDTKLPRDSVRRMVGAMAHPLNRAILDPRRRIVTQGYGLMQPRVGITVHSAARSRLAVLYSGQTGFDIYTRAVSDVYQDLYGEGIFTGKGLYEIQILHEVLDRRFPQNALLSHDLIEGAYARVGLLTDVEVMDDYPSHYSAQNRRKHRWVRGDWQILRWLLSRVPDETGRWVHNPTSNISRWKIFDNLRRSLVEPATFILLVAGWLWLPGNARYWTLATLLVVFVPVFVQFLFSVVRASVAEQGGHVRQAIRDSFGLLFTTALSFAFLAHQTLLMMDAIVRSLVRSFVTGERLLEWETAAEAELGAKKKTPVEFTMQLVPLLTLAVAGMLWWQRPAALPWALPILILWSLAKPITVWLNRPPHNLEVRLSAADVALLRKTAWRTWLYFAHYPGEHNHRLVPDNVQEEGDREACRISPTNAGLQLNARQAALILGYLTLPEYTAQTLENLRTLDQLPKWKGHLLNWYTTTDLQPIAPHIASTVDSGNFLASLLSLRMGTLERMRAPLLPPALRDGLLDALSDASDPSSAEQEWMAALESDSENASRSAASSQNSKEGWLSTLLAAPQPAATLSPAAARVAALASLVHQYLPWLHPRFTPLRAIAELDLNRPLDSYTVESTLMFCRSLRQSLPQFAAGSPSDSAALAQALLADLQNAEPRLSQLMEQLKLIASTCDRMLQATDYRDMLDPSRRLLSIGYDAQKTQRLESCYDLLASEARTGVFLAIAKGDVQQDCWFRLARKTTLIAGHPVLLSWSGTMFEYMMPTLWMQTLPETLLAQSLPIAVQVQREYVGSRRMPWGISEASHSQTDAEGNYQYHAFGVPALALNPPPKGSLVIAPYATLLALEVDVPNAVANLRKMEKLGWLGKFGFYESADYSTTTKHKDGLRYTLVRSWMAHHQGMSLLAIANLLCDKPFQRWFHSDPRVRATELLLHEKPIQATPPQPVPRASSVRFTPHLVRKKSRSGKSQP